uniref:Uncharacterized protein n=1 Tax=Vespula pensylvanica TaxID=30213 RepID=A0A834PE75_VESPE|nr:hypothetical protein H0235_004075 [Vespula pensylvanica]
MQRRCFDDYEYSLSLALPKEAGGIAKQASKASKQAKQASKQASKQARKQASKKASKLGKMNGYMMPRSNFYFLSSYRRVRRAKEEKGVFGFASDPREKSFVARAREGSLHAVRAALYLSDVPLVKLQRLRLFELSVNALLVAATFYEWNSASV